MWYVFPCPNITIEARYKFHKKSCEYRDFTIGQSYQANLWLPTIVNERRMGMSIMVLIIESSHLGLTNETFNFSIELNYNAQSSIVPYFAFL